MNTSQLNSAIRSALKIVGAALTAHGATTAANLINGEDAIGLALIVGGLIWSHFSHGEPIDPPASIGPKLFCLALAGSLAFTGCTSIKKNPLAAQRIADHVAYDVATVLLDKHPDWRPELNQAALDLQTLENQPVFDTLAVLEIIQRIPAAELQTPTARILIDGASLIVELTGDPALKPASQEALRVVVRGLRIGLQRRLAEPDALHRLSRQSVTTTKNPLPPMPVKK